MPSKRHKSPIFSEAQKKVLIATVERHLKLKTFKNQSEMALALGITQPSISSLIAGKWTPGLTTAEHIAQLEKVTLEQLIGPISDAPRSERAAAKKPDPSPFANLDVCIAFHADTRKWSAWTLAAARAGFFGSTDFPPAAWAGKLDGLETILSKARGPR